VDLKDIKAIIDLMKKNSVSEFELEKEDFKIKLKRNTGGGSAPITYEEAPLTLPRSHFLRHPPQSPLRPPRQLQPRPPIPATRKSNRR